MGLFSFLGIGKNKIREAIYQGAVIIDVRPAFAFDQHGRIPDSINIPVDRITINIERIRSMNRPVVICCEYGNDCAKVAGILRENRISNVINGGSWRSVLKKI
ncbi:MAG: rhodanese-like domain-containing protein [Chitinophagaceae bacterium]|nr:rhodanese-like domain-containing protein [Chitinophagaceae bacterium]